MVEMGRTSRGTRIRVNRCVAEADLVVSTGKVKPHYFAGWGGGAKGIFPGLGHDTDIRQNHKLKADPASSLGRADGNPCREDIEEAVRRLGRDTYLVNVVEAGARSSARSRATSSTRTARPFASRGPGARWRRAGGRRGRLRAAAGLGSLYQASKLIPPAGILLREGGVVIVAAECPEGTGPLQVGERGDLRARRAALPARRRDRAARVRDGRGDGAADLRDLRAGPRDRARARPRPRRARRTRASSCCRTQGTSCRE